MHKKTLMHNFMGEPPNLTHTWCVSYVNVMHKHERRMSASWQPVLVMRAARERAHVCYVCIDTKFTCTHTYKYLHTYIHTRTRLPAHRPYTCTDN